MKTLIVLIAVMMVVGCETPLPQRPAFKPWPIKPVPYTPGPDSFPNRGASGVTLLPESLPPLPFTELTKKGVVGSYGKGTPFKIVFSDNGMWEYYENGKKKNSQEWKWRVVGKEVRTEDIIGNGPIYIIEPNGELKWIADFMDGKRIEIQKKEQLTYIKIK